MTYKVIEKLNENQLNHLLALFKNEWWTKNRQTIDIKKMLENSNVVIGLIHEETDELVGFARVITDTVYRAFIFDVIAKEEYRNSGIGKILMDSILSHPLVRDVDRVELYCPDRLVSYYEKWGFSTDVNGSNLMRKK
ncbi:MULTISPECIES: GNAT family N-acetyltransferase [Bacillaceae]|uniref:GNAT family N-acetyltransferase n=1 Tax=Bacillaceae TaxID=186817 RepID=UPI0006F52338|nr:MULTISPECIES: GNAT family N-acetyltransferase [Bacillaceae]KQL34321.1 GCN5 family acetyltransferase [Psychrobacillus sp. FJAT-21963]MDF2066435.1 GNAT family N-acetyltransferase [Bacillus sp. Cr_A10]